MYFNGKAEGGGYDFFGKIIMLANMMGKMSVSDMGRKNIMKAF